MDRTWARGVEKPMGNTHYNVAPRYTPGSPALVPHTIAERVAREEKQAFEGALTGVYGEKDLATAKRLGLRGIVEMRQEKGRGKRSGWEVVDLCTGERFFRLSAESLRANGWARYHDLPEYQQALVAANPPTDVEDYKSAWYKLKPAMFASSPSGWEVVVYKPEPLS